MAEGSLFWGGLLLEPFEVPLQGDGDASVSVALAGPAALLGIGLEGVDVCELVGEGGDELDSGGTRIERKELPKLRKIRDIAIPRDAPAGFSLIDWLPGRIEDALAEQARGWNPRALIFPSLTGGVFGEQNIRNRVLA